MCRQEFGDARSSPPRQHAAAAPLGRYCQTQGSALTISFTQRKRHILRDCYGLTGLYPRYRPHDAFNFGTSASRLATDSPQAGNRDGFNSTHTYSRARSETLRVSDDPNPTLEDLLPGISHKLGVKCALNCFGCSVADSREIICRG
jgi:hypothetical protein